MHSKMSSAICFNLDQSKLLLPANGLKPVDIYIMQPIFLPYRFRTFEANQKDIAEMVEFWDRTTLAIKRPRTPSEKSDEDGHLQHPPSGKKAKGKGRSSMKYCPFVSAYLIIIQSVYSKYTGGLATLSLYFITFFFS